MLAVTFILRKAIGNGAPLVLAFWLGMAALVGLAFVVTGRNVLARALRIALVIALLLVGALTLLA